MHVRLHFFMLYININVNESCAFIITMGFFARAVHVRVDFRCHVIDQSMPS